MSVPHMDNDRARFILGAYRPSGADGSDPVFAEALEHVRVDERLTAWFERELAGDRAIAATLRTIRAPAGLKAQILSGAQAQLSSRKTRRLDLKTTFVALAAAASVALAVFTLWPKKPAVSSFHAIVAAAAAESLKTLDLSFYAPSSRVLIEWLDQSGAPAPMELPPSLGALPTLGCRKLSWEGVPASLVSFRARYAEPGDADASRETVLFLYTVLQSSCSGGAAAREPVVFARAAQAVATWRDQKHFYILVANIPDEALRSILRGHAPIMASL